MRRKLPLRVILMAGMVGLVSITVAIIALGTFISSKKVFLTHAKDIMENIASYTIDKSLSHLKPARDAAELTSGLADNEIVTSENKKAMEQYFYEQLRLYPQIYQIFYGSTEGEFIMTSRFSNRDDAEYMTKIISTPDKTPGAMLTYRNSAYEATAEVFDPEDSYDPRVRPWYKDAKAEMDLVWTDPYVFSASRKPGITTASPVFDENGNLTGVVGVDILIDELSDFIAQLKIGKNGKAFILNENGDVIAFHDITKLTHSVGNSNGLRLVTISELDDEASRIAYRTLKKEHPGERIQEREFISFKVQGSKYHGMFAPFHARYWPWIIGVYVPEEDYLGVLNKNLMGNITIALGLAFISSIIGWIMASSITRSMRQIHEGVQLIRKSDFSTPLHINSIYKEIQETGDLFGTMREELRSYSNDLENLVHSRTADLEKSNAELFDEIKRRQQTEKDLQYAVEAAKQANEAKSTFLANISHEIRTPLNGIMGFADLLHATRDVDEEVSYAGTIIQESERLLLLINQLLDISKIESGKLVLEKHKFKLESVLDAMRKSFEKEIQRKSLTFVAEIDERIPPFVYGDSLRLSQILLNLISNAVKFTDKGTISVTCRYSHDQDGRLFVTFKVTDTGIGIPKEKQNKIFESFSQADPSISRKYGGTGLGITIARELIHLMKGDISLESIPGEGTEFSFTIPFDTSGDELQIDESNQTEPGINLANRTVLIVEDYSVNKDIIVAFMKLLDAEILTASDGFEALEIYTKHNIDLILMDVHMPGLNGIETTRRVREMGDSRVPIIGVTAHAFEWEIKKCVDSGMDSVVTKPFRRKQLFSAIQKVFNSRENISNSPGEETETEREESSGSSEAPLDLLSSELGGNRELASQIRSEYLNSLQEDLHSMKESWEQGDMTTAHRTAHSLGSGAGNIFENYLMEKFRNMESFLKSLIDDGAPGEEDRKQFDHLYGEIINTIGAMEGGPGKASGS